MTDKSIIIAGAGFTGAYIGRNLAELGWKVRIIERYNHIAGHMYDKVDKQTGCLVHEYGPHIFHTDDDDIWEWINQFSSFTPYNLKTRVLFDTQAKWLTCSFGFHTIEQLFDSKQAEDIIGKLKKDYPGRKSVTIPELLKSDDASIKKFVDILWNEDYKPYTAKQWGLKPDEVDSDILKRVPVYLSYFDKIHDKKYECIPSNGYTELFDAILDHKNISIQLSTDVISSLTIKDNNVYYEGELTKLLFTGAIDELFDYKYGPLNYRSLKFVKEITPNDKSAIEGDPSVDIYPHEKYEYTRITNYGKLPLQSHLNEQVSVKEYALDHQVNGDLGRYYPVSTPNDKALFQKYKKLADSINGLYMSGRLADYKYYDMDKALIAARATLNKILEEM